MADCRCAACGCCKHDHRGWSHGWKPNQQGDDMEQKPSVGRIVHYVSYGTPGGEYGKECRAAVVTELAQPDEDSDIVGLAVLNPTGMFFNRAARDDDAQPQGGTWHWPERV